MKILSLDVYTMLVLLAFGNIGSLLILLSYRGLSSDKRVYVQFMLGRMLQALAWGLLSFRGRIPDLVSAQIGNVILFLGFALECIAFINLRKPSSRVEKTWLALALAGSLAFCALAGSPSTKVAWASLITTIMYLPTAVLILRHRDSSMLHRVMGLVFGLFSMFLIFRAWYGFTAPEDFYLLSTSRVQTLAFMPLFFMLLGGSTGFLLLLKEQDDQLITESRDKYNTLFRSAPYSIVISSLTDMTVLEVNECFERTTGYSREEVCGKSIVDMKVWVKADDRKTIRTMIDAEKHLDQYELKYRCKSGETRTCLMSAEVIVIGHDRLLFSSFNDIESRKRMEEGIQQLLSDKELLLKEVHHRIKNNINTITSLLKLQADMADTDSAKGSLFDAANRMHGMSLLYDKLYATSDYKTVPIKEYFQVLTVQLGTVFPGREFVQIHLDIDDTELPPKILSPLGLIINELFTNSMKYAFRDRQTGTITISMRASGQELAVRYQDDGPGIHKKPEGSHFGLVLVESLAGQLGSSMTVFQESGLAYEFRLAI
ncbi:MAG: histidine kinase dimerization/phosphoacceptor domain -containing protein [Spirochaetia bacterium]|nr:histidine kinase dimerization/phosphoacceptor domain -containing protein [Spirochaetia bacterium]